MDAEYDEKTIRFLEYVWGEGYLSPGGSEEVDLIVKKLQFDNATVLDLGCGTGGITVHLADKYDLKKIVGFDVEEPSITFAKKRLESFQSNSKVTFIEGTPGTLPFSDSYFDIVFSKDALIHVENKVEVASDIHRVLKPGGVFRASDWVVSANAVQSHDVKAWLDSEGFEFLPATTEQYELALERAGFHDISLISRNHWHKHQVENEIHQIEVTHFDELNREFGEEFVRDQLQAWKLLQVVVEKGEVFPVHIYGRKGTVAT